MRFLVLLMTILFLVGCASGDEYGPNNPQNRTIKPITVPAGTSSGEIQARYVVPAAPRGEQWTKPSLVPPGAKEQ